MSKLKKLTAIFLSAVMLVCCFTVNASAGGSEILSLKSGRKTTAFIEAGKTATYEFFMSQEGDFILDAFMEGTAWARINVYDAETNELFIPADMPTERGQGGYDVNLKSTRILWEIESEPHTYKGKIRYWLPEGRYYLKLKIVTAKEELPADDYKNWKKDGNKDSGGKITFTANYAAGIEYFEITMKKGSTIQLGAILSSSGKEKITWSSSKKKVAAVSSSGKITAKKAGTAVITAKVGNSTAKIQIKVTK